MLLWKKIKEFKFYLSSRAIIVALSIYFGYFLNMSLLKLIFNKVVVGEFVSVLFFLSTLLLIFLLYFIIFNCFLITKYSKIPISILLLISAQMNYCMFRFGMYVDVDMIQKVFEMSQQKEIFGSITLDNTIWFLMTGILPVLIFTRYSKINFRSFLYEFMDRVYCIAGALCLIFIICLANYKNYSELVRNNKNSKKLINTVNYIYSTAKYLKNKLEKEQPLITIDDSVKYVGEHLHKTLLIFVQGKSARSANFSLGGYEKNKTNPLLSKQDIIYYDMVESCGTNAQTSLPCIFSHFDRSGFSFAKAKNYENVLDLLKKVGYNVVWVNNFGVDCKGVCGRIKTDVVKKDPVICLRKYCRDEILLNNLNKQIQQNMDKNSVVVLNTVGSYGSDYYKRYSGKFKKFNPTCDVDDITKCDKNSIINSYDNTILYTDWFLSSVIDVAKKIQDRSVAVIYTSDHGESLGESNIYLHGIPYSIAPKFQKQVPMIVYMNDLMRQEHRFSYDCLKGSSRKKNFSHDNIFHSLLGLLEVRSKLYNEKLDIFKRCRIKK